MYNVRAIYFYKFVQEKDFIRGLYNTSLKGWSGGKQLILFLSNLNRAIYTRKNKTRTFRVNGTFRLK